MKLPRSLFRPLSTLNRVTLAGALVGLLAAGVAGAEPVVGKNYQNPTLRDGSDKPATLPEFGQKVVLVMYTDPDVADQNDAFADAVKGANLSPKVYRSIGVANMKDAPFKPDGIIRSVVRGKIKKYGVTILTDPKRLLIEAWDLGDCNDKSVVLIFDEKGVLKYAKKGELSPEERTSTLALIKDLVAKAEAAGVGAAPAPAP